MNALAPVFARAVAAGRTPTADDFLALLFDVGMAARHPTADAAVSNWRRMRGAMRLPWKGVPVAVLTQPDGTFHAAELTAGLHLAYLEGRTPRGRMTIRRA